MKTKQYCILVNDNENLSVSTFDYTEKSSDEIIKFVYNLAINNDITEDLCFDWGCPENILFVRNKFDTFSVSVMLSEQAN